MEGGESTSLQLADASEASPVLGVETPEAGARMVRAPQRPARSWLLGSDALLCADTRGCHGLAARLGGTLDSSSQGCWEMQSEMREKARFESAHAACARGPLK